MDDSSCDVLSSSAITTVSVAETQCAFCRISHGHVADLLFPHVKDTFSRPNNSPLVLPTQSHFFNCPPKTLVVHFSAIRIGTFFVGETGSVFVFGYDRRKLAQLHSLFHVHVLLPLGV